MKKLLFITLIAIAAMMTACESEVFENSTFEEQAELQTLAPKSKVKVVKLGDYLKNNAQTRCLDSEEEGYLQDEEVLCFEDEDALEETLEELEEMSEEEKVEYFESIGFEGACVKLYDADEELDTIFDIEDDEEFMEAYLDFKTRNNELFVYNDSNEYDLSPYLPFTDEVLELVGSVHGYVIVGSEVVTPKITRDPWSEPSSGNPPAVVLPPNPATDFGYFIHLTNYAKPVSVINEPSLVIKHGKYRSDISLMEHKGGAFFIVRCASQKMHKLYSRRAKASYKAEFTLCGRKYLLDWAGSSSPIRMEVSHLIPYQYHNQTIVWDITSFTSSCCENTVGRETFSIPYIVRY